MNYLMPRPTRTNAAEIGRDMNLKMPAAMADALRLIRSGRLAEATDLLRNGASGIAGRPVDEAGPAPAQNRPSFKFDLSQLQDHLPQGLNGMLNRRGPAAPAAPVPAGSAFLDLNFANAHGSRRYKLYVPAKAAGQAVPLIVMLHGCTQNPDDFAAGTRMNELAEEAGFVVAYPAQPKSSNPSGCWNWFDAAHQQTERGEPSLIAGITRQIMRDHSIDPARVFIAGLSAGGATALNMAILYPDLFAAAGVHSGLPFGAAQDMPSAFTAMRQGASGRTAPASRVVPTILFHGSQDGTVHPRNAAQIIDQAKAGRSFAEVTERGETAGGHSYSQVSHADASGQVMIEQWTVNGAGHAWFGGSSSGSYTDPLGPDASKEMVRFFLAQQRSAKH